jgi:hypothetical protein
MYDFKQLSPADFEDLTRDLLQEEWKVRLEAFKNGRDAGIDLRYAVAEAKSFVVQCKHFASSPASTLIRHLRKGEYPKILRLKPKRYVLVTSVALNPSDKDKITAALHPFIKNTHDIFGADDLNNLIGKHSEIEIRHFKLWLSSTAVLQRVLHNASRVQTQFDVDRVRRNIPLYVQTSNYTRANKILSESRFVITSGVPGIGKTTLADMLLFAHLEAGYQPVIIKSEISQGRDLFDSEAPQVFYFDDFLGETFLGNRFEFLGKKEDSAILDFMELVSRSKRARLILTTREHVLQHAYQISEHFRRQKLQVASHKYILELSDYSLLDRGRILYNHVYFSDLPQSFKSELLKHDFYMRILKHRNFNPRIIEWLSRFVNLKSIRSGQYQQEVIRVLENPEQLWRIAFEQQISDAARSVLLALYSLGGNADLDRLGEAWKALHQHRARKYNWKGAPEDFRRALQDLEGGFLKFERRRAAFVNPSVKDFLDAMLGSDAENGEDLLAAARSFEQIVNIWSLAQSDKGKELQLRLKRSPEQLMAAIEYNLQHPHEERTEEEGSVGVREIDVRPEIRLRTMLSIAEQTKSNETLRIALDYCKDLVEFWRNHRPDFQASVEVLKAAERQTGWGQRQKSHIYSKVKTALLGELDEGDSIDFGSLVDYKHWSNDDRSMLVKSFQAYLHDEFDFELSNFDDQEELADFLDRLEDVASWCDLDIEAYLDQIRDAIVAMEAPDYDDVSEVREWDGSRESMPEDLQEREVKRIFSGLPVTSDS